MECASEFAMKEGGFRGRSNKWIKLKVKEEECYKEKLIIRLPLVSSSVLVNPRLVFSDVIEDKWELMTTRIENGTFYCT